LLAFDGSPKSTEALFVATYLAGHWQVPLAIVSVGEPSCPAPEVLQRAHTYVQEHGLQAELIERSGPVPDAILETASGWHADVIILGGYGYKPVLEAVLGSSVDRLLRESREPMLICR
jgi:nucleotide-binding universal stress UspA family protein